MKGFSFFASASEFLKPFTVNGFGKKLPYWHTNWHCAHKQKNETIKITNERRIKILAPAGSILRHNHSDRNYLQNI
jgi:hypothetical protein